MIVATGLRRVARGRDVPVFEAVQIGIGDRGCGRVAVRAQPQKSLVVWSWAMTCTARKNVSHWKRANSHGKPPRRIDRGGAVSYPDRHNFRTFPKTTTTIPRLPLRRLYSVVFNDPTGGQETDLLALSGDLKTLTITVLKTLTITIHVAGRHSTTA